MANEESEQQDTTAGVMQLYGEPLDSGFALAEEHQLAGDLSAACAVYDELLTFAESIEDSPDVRFLRAHLLSNLASVRLTATDLAGAEDAVERARTLMDGIASAPMGPRGRQLWLEMLLRTLIAGCDLMRRTGRLDEALACLDEAAARLPEFDDPEGLRASELALNRVLLLMDRGEWGPAEDHATALLSTLETTEAAELESVPRLLTALAMICSSTGRFDEAEDHLARAEERYRALGDIGEQRSMLAYRAWIAMDRGEHALAERLFAEASAYFEQQQLHGDLATCEQARAYLAGRRGDMTSAGDLTTASLARFEQLGASLAAADTMLLGAQHAYARGDIEEMKRLAQTARDVYQEREVYERCAQVDLMLATTLEDNLNRTDHGAHERRSIDNALSLALPAALTLQAARYDFATAHARAQWLQLADEGMELAFRLAVRRQDQGLLFELVEHRSAGATLSLNPDPRPSTTAEDGTRLFPNAAMKAERAYERADAPTTLGGPGELGGVAAEAAASAGLRVAPPPKVRMAAQGPGRVALQEYIESAEFRYHRRIVNDEEVPFWITDDLTSRPVVQVRLADAGDLFMTWTWAGGAKGFGTGWAPADEVDRAVGKLAAALPTSGEGAAGMRRAFETSPLTNQATEHDLARLLAEALWPEGLTAQIRQVSARAGRPLIRIQPSPRVAQVPWELLAVDEKTDTRLLDLADVVTTAPTSLRRQPNPKAEQDGDKTESPSDTVVLVLDPRIPGFRADSPLGSVLGPAGSDPELLTLVQNHLDAGRAVPSVATPAEVFRRTDLDRDWLSDVLRKGARRLLYVGHVSGAPIAGGQSEDGTLHLCCDPHTTGLTDPIRTHRPLSAKDLLLGTLPLRPDGEPGSRIWPAPPRVALIGCESAADLRFTEPFGLATAMLHNGADLVTATRWTLPTSFAYHHLAKVPESVRPLSEAIRATDRAHEHPDPVSSLATWQHEQLDHWRSEGRIEHSPLLWAAMTCIVV